MPNWAGAFESPVSTKTRSEESMVPVTLVRSTSSHCEPWSVIAWIGSAVHLPEPGVTCGRSAATSQPAGSPAAGKESATVRVDGQVPPAEHWRASAADATFATVAMLRFASPVTSNVFRVRPDRVSSRT